MNVQSLINTWVAVAENFKAPGGPVGTVSYGTRPETATADTPYPLVHIETEPEATVTEFGIQYRGAFWVLDKEADADSATAKALRLQAQGRAQEIARAMVQYLVQLEESQDRPWFARPLTNTILFVSDDFPDRVTGVRVEYTVETITQTGCEWPLGYNAGAITIPKEQLNFGVL